MTKWCMKGNLPTDHYAFSLSILQQENLPFLQWKCMNLTDQLAKIVNQKQS